MTKIGFIGAGNMAFAIIEGIFSSPIFKDKYPNTKFIISDKNNSQLERFKSAFVDINIANSNVDLAKKADILFLSIKPQNAIEVLEEISNHISEEKLIVSIMAGITMKKISQYLSVTQIARVMPNSPALIQQGMTAVSFSDKITVKYKQIILDIFSTVGKAITVDEELQNAATAVSGSGPAFIYKVAQSIISAAKNIGLDKNTAQTLVAQTLVGAGAMLLKNENIDTLIKNVASPGGTTEAGLKVFNEDTKWQETLQQVIIKSKNRADELSWD